MSSIDHCVPGRPLCCVCSGVCVLFGSNLSVSRDVKAHLNYEHRVFHSEEFLRTRAPGDQRFYGQVSVDVAHCGGVTTPSPSAPIPPLSHQQTQPP